MAVAGSLQLSQQASADKYDDQINALQQNINAYNAEAARLNGEAQTLQSALASLANQVSSIQAQINLSQAKYDQLVIDIANTEKKIKDNQDALGETIANLYVDDKITPLEMIASSKNVSDYLDKQEYRNSVRDQLSSTIKQIKVLKAQLDQQKADVTKVLADQQSSKNAMVEKQTEQQNLLNQTQGQEAAYQQMIGDSQSQINAARATQAALNARFNSSGGYTLVSIGGGGGYPWNSSNCPMSGYLSTGGTGDGLDGHNYGCRQCASYVAWRIASETGRYYSWGNAVNFTSNAQAAYGVGDGRPHAGSIAVMDAAKAGQGYGHVAWVEAVNGDGTITVSQYNYDYGQGYGMYSMMKLSAGAFDHYVQIK
ncbi:MAG: CHAP domain-containing protein [Candidatus Saccharibacteria bacterium]